MFYRKCRIRKQTFPPVAPDGSESALMTLHPRDVYKNDVFIDHTHWRERSENSVGTVEREESFASQASKRGKILTIGSPRVFLILRSVQSSSMVLTLMHLSIVCPTIPCGGEVGGYRGFYSIENTPKGWGN